MNKVQVDSAPRVVADRLRRDIQLGKFAPGDMLPPQHEFARALGVSLVTLREALRILEGEGFVEMRRGAAGGSLVLASSEPIEVTRQKLIARLDEFYAWLDFRRAVESAAAGLAAVHATPEQLDMLEDTIIDTRRATSSHPFRAADSSFHLGIAIAAQNEPMRQAVEDARAALWQPIDLIPFDPMQSRTIRDHEEILSALRSRDPEQAQAAMSAHIERVREEMQMVLRGGGRKPRTKSARPSRRSQPT